MAKKLDSKVGNIFSKHTIILCSLILCFLNNCSEITSIERSSKWITVSYEELIDPNSIIRTGQNLKSALKDPALRNAVQPFVDSYSYLLPYVFEMVTKPDVNPFHSVVDNYPVGTKQPVWVSIFRGGRIHISTDYNGHARVFILGKDPRKAYLKQYSVIRHCLNGLSPSNGLDLKVEVFAYENDYKKSELRLNTTPYVVNQSGFTSNKEKTISLDGLDSFFNQGPEIQGAELNRSTGLTFYGKKTSKQTLSGKKVSLSDLAVAYRAVFHAGDNEAFISLDPHFDPIKTTVNFGGFLEDTHIGGVVLEADKRFKTITSGLDPNSFKDLRHHIREKIPSFMSGSERSLLYGDFKTRGKWTGTRFWFYPDTIGVDSDLNYQYAVITNPRFTADAERSKDDFQSKEEFERKKQSTLSPSIRHNIDHLNNNYEQYANIFGEIKELSTVAEIMGLCSWLYKANPEWLDLDALLSVELPPFQTPRESTKLMATIVISYLYDLYDIDEFKVINNSKVVYLSPILEEKVGVYFKNHTNIAKYLSIKNNTDIDSYSKYRDEATLLFNSYKTLQVKNLIKNKEDLRALTAYASHSLDTIEPKIIKHLENKLTTEKDKLNKLESEINKIKAEMRTASSNYYNSLVDRYNQLVKQYNLTRNKHNKNVDEFNQLGGLNTQYIMSIGGGINLEPRHFNIKTNATSRKLIAFKNISKKVGKKWEKMSDLKEWIKSVPEGNGVTEFKNTLPKKKWDNPVTEAIENVTYRYSHNDSNQKFWLVRNSQNDSWRSLEKVGDIKHIEKSYDWRKKQLHIVKFHKGKADNYITGETDVNGKIVFRKSARNDLLPPQEPPIWWIKDVSNY